MDAQFAVMLFHQKILKLICTVIGISGLLQKPKS